MKLINCKRELFSDLHKHLISSLIGRLLQGESFDESWKLEIFHDMVSLVIYQSVIHRFDTKKFGKHQDLMDDIIKTNTILSVPVIIKNDAFVKSHILNINMGVILYHIFIRKMVHSYIKPYLPENFDLEGFENCIEEAILLSIDGQFSFLPYRLGGLIVYHFGVKTLFGNESTN